MEKGKPDQDRGNLDVKQLQAVENKLDAIDPGRLNSAIRIAIIHHHPVLIPPLAEAGRGYDAVHNSGKLLTILRKYGFHLILHGHKHNPFTFTDDTQSAFLDCDHQPILIVAGGSVASTNLPESPRACNCYNRITVKWHFQARQSRILVQTRGLTVFNTDGTEQLPDKWKWHTLRIDDRRFIAGDVAPRPMTKTFPRFSPTKLKKDELKRQARYLQSRGNMPVVEVMPSMIPGQAYEARVWIVGHKRRHQDIPARVIWSCGKNFGTVPISQKEDEHFCAIFNYWGPMLVQARLEFSDGSSELVQVYARMPTSYP